MKKKLLIALVTGIFLAGLNAKAKADIIVDTGSVTTVGASVLSSSAGGGLAQWLAAEFSLSKNYYITDIQGLILNNDQTGKSFTISIYGDGGETPDSNNLIFSNQATISGTNGQANWEGYHISYGNGLELAQGTYWVSFEVRPNNYANPYSGSMPTVKNPLVNEAYARGVWIGLDTLDIGVRIQGTPAPVPEPATMLLLCTGLAGLAVVRKKKKG